ncbi:MAG: TetR family transcriptional regulator [Ignavibacteria bacterium]|nr:MAG: TetR family transcriptional regulator [Ignavibacteria bacterium]
MDNHVQKTQYSETEEKIFVAALEEFSKKGRSGARMQDIADRAGINKALIHYYFRSKEKLYEEVFTFVIRKFFYRLSEFLSAEETFENTLKTFIDKYIDLLEDQPALPFLLLRDVSEGADVFRERVQKLLLPLPTSVPQVFREKFITAVKRGEVRDDDPAQVLITMIGACLFFHVAYPIFSTLFPHARTQRQQFIAERKEHLFNTLYYGLQVRPESEK